MNQLSADGHWRWDGYQWVPSNLQQPAYLPAPAYAGPRPGQRSGSIGKWVGIAVGLLFVLWLVRGCAAAVGSTSTSTAATEPASIASPVPDGPSQTDVYNSYRKVVIANMDAIGTSMKDACSPFYQTTCKASMDSLDKAVAGMKADLATVTVPNCLTGFDTELRAGLDGIAPYTAKMRDYANDLGGGNYAKARAEVEQASALATASTDHTRRATTLLKEATCP